MIRLVAQQEMGDRPPFGGPVEVELRAVFDIPQSWSQKKREAAILWELLPTKRPDIDNVVKAWTDGMNGVVFRDDAQIVQLTARKVYGPQSLVAVTVTEVGE